MSTSHAPLARRKLIKSSLALAVAPAALGVGVAHAQSKTTVTWKVQAHWPKASSSFKDSLEWFAAELGRRTGGRFKMQLFGAGELAKDAEIYNIVKRGVVEMGTLAPDSEVAPKISLEVRTSGSMAIGTSSNRQSSSSQHRLWML